MENPEEILHCLEEFSKLKPKDIPRELEDYLSFVAKTGDPVYQWGIVKSLFKEKLINVITDFYESCPTIEVPPCPNVEVFNYDNMKSFILEKLDTFVAAPFTVQRISELLITPRKEYNRIDKFMRALEKNILVVSTTEPLNRRAVGNGDGIVNGLESEHVLESNANDINVEEMDDTPIWSRVTNDSVPYINRTSNITAEADVDITNHPELVSEIKTAPIVDSVITCRPTDNQPYVSIEPVVSDNCVREESAAASNISVTITAIPAAVQKRRDSIEPIVSSVAEPDLPKSTQAELEVPETKEDIEMAPSVSSSPSDPVIAETTHIEIIPPSDPAEPVQSEALQSEALESEALHSEAEPSIVEIPNIPLATLSPEITTNVVQLENSIVTEDESNSMIQIPVVSEIASVVNTSVYAEISIESPISQHEDSSSEESQILNEPSEVLEEVSTSTPETVVCSDSPSNFASTPELMVETTVSSSDDLNSEAVELKCSQTTEDSSPEESSSESVDNSSEAQEKQTEEVPLCDDQELASSSTISEPMDMNIEEETCQEAPTSNR